MGRNDIGMETLKLKLGLKGGIWGHMGRAWGHLSGHGGLLFTIRCGMKLNIWTTDIHFGNIDIRINIPISNMPFSLMFHMCHFKDFIRYGEGVLSMKWLSLIR